MIAPGDVAVVVAVRDGERYLAETLEAILSQTALPGEVVVVDDGSTDGSADLARSFGPPVRVISQPPTGQAAALNAGVRDTRSSWLGFCDADDLWPARSLALRLAIAGEAGTSAVVYGATEQFVSPEVEGSRAVFDPGPVLAPHLGATLAPRTVLADVGPLDETLRFAAGVEWVARARRRGVAELVVDEVVYRRRIHASNHGNLTRPGRAAGLLGVVRQHHHAAHRTTAPPP